MSKRDRFSSRVLAICAARCGMSMSPRVVSVEYSRARSLPGTGSRSCSADGVSTLGKDELGLNTGESEPPEPFLSAAMIQILTATQPRVETFLYRSAGGLLYGNIR